MHTKQSQTQLCETLLIYWINISSSRGIALRLCLSKRDGYIDVSVVHSFFSKRFEFDLKSAAAAEDLRHLAQPAKGQDGRHSQRILL